MNTQYISEAFDQLRQMNRKTNKRRLIESEKPYIKTIYSFRELKNDMGPFKLGKTLLYDYYDPDAYGDWSEQPVKGVNSEEEFLSLFKLRNGGLYLPKGTILDFVGDDYYHDWFSLNDTDKEIGFLSDYAAYDESLRSPRTISSSRKRVVKESTTRRNLRKPLKENVPEESTRAYELIDLIVDYEDILGYATEDEKGQDVYVKYNTHTKECVVYKRDASGLPVIISFSTIPISRYKRKEKQEYIDELPSTEYGKSVYR